MENNQFRSFRQQKRSVKDEIYDTSKTLSYEEALSNVKKALKKEVETALDEETRKRKEKVIEEKDKKYLRETMNHYRTKIWNIVANEDMHVFNMTTNELVETLLNELEGRDILEDAFQDEKVTDIFIYSWNKIYVERDGENELYLKKFRNEMHYNVFLTRLISEAESALNAGANKKADFELWGDRYCATHRSISPNGDSLTIRKHSESHIRLSHMLEAKVLDEKLARFFYLIIKGQTNFIISGITGSGKTTDLRAILDEYVVKLNRRVITSEDTRELFLENEQTLELLTFPSKEEETRVTQSDNIHTSLRLKPRYIVVGEVRGPEAEAAVEAAATGHSTIFTSHAIKEIDAINRLVINYQKAMPKLSSDIVESIISNAIDFIVIKKNIPGIGRKITSVSEVGYNEETRRIAINKIMKYNYKADTFDFVGTFSEEVLEKMYGSGVTTTELETWEMEANVYDLRASA